MYPRLYKYCKFSYENYDLQNLKNDVLFFNSPCNYNDPYEGLISVSVSKTVEAFLIAQVLSSSKSSDSLIKEILKAFELPNIIYSINDGSDLDMIRNELLPFISEATTRIPISEEQSAAIKLLNDDSYLRAFQKISNAEIFPEEYQNIITKSLPKVGVNATVPFIDKMVGCYSEKFFIVNNYRAKTSLLVPIFLIDAIYYTPYKCDSYEETLVKYNDIAKESFNILRNMPGKLFRTTCFSEHNDSVLMWSHYSDNHTGFCIEYDFNVSDDNEKTEIINHLWAVDYSDRMSTLDLQSIIQIIRKKINPTFEKDPMMTEITATRCVEAILIKHSAWEYESEWRMVLNKNNSKEIMSIPYAKKIIMGVQIENKNKELLIALARQKGIPIFQAYLKPDKYEIGIYPVAP